jgi:hypothetical protein
MLYIHIGTPKTGTTSLQAFLTEHAAALEARGVIYPAVGRTHRGKHHSLKAELRSTVGLGGPAWQELRELRNSKPDHRVLISEESFYYLEPTALTKLRELAGEGPVTILVYFRDYAAHAIVVRKAPLARGLQMAMLGTKAGNELVDFETFFERYMAKPSHFDIISRWASKSLGIDQYARTSETCLSAVTSSPIYWTSRLKSRTWDTQVHGSQHGARLEDSRDSSCNMAGPGENARRMYRWSNPAVRNLCREVVESTFAEDPRIEYLSLAQRERCAQATASDVAALRQSWRPGSVFPLPAEGERLFLPTIDRVPIVELADIIAAMAIRLGNDRAKQRTKGDLPKSGAESDQAATKVEKRQKRASKASPGR